MDACEMLAVARCVTNNNSVDSVAEVMENLATLQKLTYHRIPAVKVVLVALANPASRS